MNYILMKKIIILVKSKFQLRIDCNPTWMLLDQKVEVDNPSK